jgi:hypothetical protein
LPDKAERLLRRREMPPAGRQVSARRGRLLRRRGTRHGHPSDRTSKARYSQAIAGDESTAPTFAVRPSFVVIERSDRNAAICWR